MGNSLLLLAAGASVLAGGVDAVKYQPLHATVTYDIPIFDNQVPPAPTQAPVDRLRRRQRDSTSSASNVFFIAPDKTCGYVSGLSTAAYTCNGDDYSCVMFTATGNLPGNIACCDGSNCGARATCYDRDQVISETACDQSCLENTRILKCTNSAAAFCNTISFSSNIWDFFCNSNSGSSVLAATTTFDGQSNPDPWRTVPITGNDDSITRPTVSSTSSDDPESTSTSRSESDRASGTTARSQPSETDGGGGGDDEDEDGGGGGTPVGAIVGGVVGGIAVVAAILLIFWFVKRRQKKSSPPPQMHQTPPPQMQPSPYQGPPVAPYGAPGVAPPMHPHSPNSMQQPMQQMQQPYDPKFGYAPGYGHQQSPAGYYNAANLAPDRNQTASPASMSNTHRASTLGPASPISTTNGGYAPYGPVAGQQGGPPAQQPIHEAPTNPDHHRGQMHELA